jgi:hypothetical protein
VLREERSNILAKWADETKSCMREERKETLNREGLVIDEMEGRERETKIKKKTF